MLAWGLRELAKIGAFGYAKKNGYELDHRYTKFYAVRKHKDNCDDVDVIHFGASSGDMLNVPLSHLQGSQALLAGPPCEGNTENGTRKGTGDPRAEVLERVVDWTIELAWRGELLFYAIENSLNMLKLKNSPDDDITYGDSIIKKLEVGIPHFLHDTCHMSLTDVLPHQRKRLWFRGMRVDTIPGKIALPPPLDRTHLPTLELFDILDASAPPVLPCALTLPRRENVIAAEAKILKDMSEGRAGRLACFEVDRCSKNTWTTSIYYDKSLALRVKGPDIFILSTADVSKDPSDRQFHRFLLESERFHLQGHSASYAADFGGKCLARQATGNAYAVPQLAAVMIPMAAQTHASGASHMAPLSESQISALAVRKRRRLA